MDIRLDGKVALVTGASRGIGLAMAKTMAESGASVMMVSRRIDESSTEGIDGEVSIHAANTGDVEAGRRCVESTLDKYGRIDVLVNNAATNPYFGDTLGVDEARYDKTFQVNLRGPVFWTASVWDSWMKDNPGVILNVASVGGIRSESGLGVYNLTKAALIHLTRQLAGELGPSRVVGIAPGLVATDFAAFLVDNFGDRLAAALPTKRLGDPQDIANLATFLVSDAASWITGETYVIDGGAGTRST
ncbi:MAG: SDR family oxidoreductase [Actinomycetota bacterium]|nr:SDR family oxidoreductase [Actinomycetota bacterium]MDA2971226.1 SDR family oxidoreductase [Actinomycetota bacterium]MDA3000998.1 SDR family oxidoreductase [Actinomycetota bacterium]